MLGSILLLIAFAKPMCRNFKLNNVRLCACGNIVANAGGLLPGWYLKNVPPGY